MAATQYVDIVGSGFVQGVSGTFANCRVYYDGTQILHVGPLYVNWPAPPPPVRAGASVDVTAFGAAGNGTSDDTAAIAAAIAAVAATASAAGEVYFPPGIYLSGPQTLTSTVHLRGAGIEATILKLQAGSNADLFSAQTNLISLGATYGTGSAGSLYDFSIRNMTLDGNKANQTSGTSYPLRFYGYGYTLENLRVRNGRSGGILSDWNGGSGTGNTIDNMESFWSNVKVHDTGGIGIQFGGPHDSMLVNVISYNNLTHAFHFAPNCGGTHLTHGHGYGCTAGQKGCSYLIEAGPLTFANCQAEGGDTVQIAVLNDEFQWFGGRVYDIAGSTTSGIQIGQQAGLTPFPGALSQSAGVTSARTPQNCYIETNIEHCEGTNGALYLANEGGYNTYRIHVNNTSGKVATGTLNINSNFVLTQNGLTPDGTTAKGGIVAFTNKANVGMAVRDGTHTLFNVNTNAARFELANATAMRVYSDDFSTTVLQLNADNAGSMVSNGSLSVGQSATTPDPGNNGTITTAGIGLARVTPTANRTGVILQAGTQPGQRVTVVNNSASFTVQFAASGTSHVALGTGLTIAVNGKQVFIWDSVASLWY